MREHTKGSEETAVGEYSNCPLASRPKFRSSCYRFRMLGKVWCRGQLARPCHRGISTSCVTVTPYPASSWSQPLLSPGLKISPTGWSLDFSRESGHSGYKGQGSGWPSPQASVSPVGAEPGDFRECPLRRVRFTLGLGRHDGGGDESSWGGFESPHACWFPFQSPFQGAGRMGIC